MNACHMQYGVSRCAKRKETQEFFDEEQAAKKKKKKLMEGNGFQLLRYTVHRMIKVTKKRNEEKAVSVYWWPVENPLLLFAFAWSLQQRYMYMYKYVYSVYVF